MALAHYAFVGGYAPRELGIILDMFQSDPQLSGLSPGSTSNDQQTGERIVHFNASGAWAADDHTVKSMVCSFNAQGDLTSMHVALQSGSQPMVNFAIKRLKLNEECQKPNRLTAGRAIFFHQLAQLLSER